MKASHKVLLLILVILISGLLVSKKILVEEHGRESQDSNLGFSVGTTSEIVQLTLPEGIELVLDSGWRVFSLDSQSGDYLRGAMDGENTFYDGQVGVPWFLYSDLEVMPKTHFTLVSPQRWSQLTETSSDQLNQFGYLGEPPRFIDLLREFDVVVLPKQKDQTLQQYLAEVDARALAKAQISYANGEAVIDVVESAQKGFFGNFESREAKTMSFGVETLLLSGRTTPSPLDAEQFLILACPAGSKVIVVNKGPYAMVDIEHDYLQYLREIRDQVGIQKKFCK